MTKSAKPKGVVLQGDFRQRLLKEFLVISDMATKKGHPRGTVIGTERRQMDLILGVRVMLLLEAQYKEGGYVIDPAMDTFLTDRGRRMFVGSILNAESRFKIKSVSGAPLETLYKSSGKFIRIRITEPQSRPGPGRYRYVTKETASEVEVRAAFNTQRQEEETRAGVATDRLQVFAEALQCWPAGAATFEQAFAIEAQNRLQQR